MIIEDKSRNADGYMSSEWDSRNSKKGILRPRFMSAADYAFYLRRHLVAERRKNDPGVGHPGDETLSVGIPRLSFLLRRLEEDIQSSYLSFLEEFVSDVHEGVSCLLNILRTSQERQKGAGLFTYVTLSRAKQSLINKGVIDEFYCLLCLKACSKSSEAVIKIADHKTGLATVSSCITSSHVKSRIVALEILTAVCRAPEIGSNRVLEAMTTVRILFGESVRFKFLVSVLNSNLANSSGLETVTLIFLNTLLDQCAKLSDRVRIQSELEEAGFDVDSLEKQLRQKFGNSPHRIWGEIDKWKELHVDLQDVLQKHHENINLRKEVQLLKEALKRLRDERKGIISIHKQLKGQWNNVEQRLQDLALKSRVMATSSSSSDEESGRPAPPNSRYKTIPSMEPTHHDSELDEILIDIPTIPAGSILNPENGADFRIPDTPPPLPPNHPKLSDSGISSNSALDSELDANDWHYPDVPGIRMEKRHSSVRVRFSEGTACRRSRSSGGVTEIPPGTVILQPGQNRIKCVDILGVQNIPPPLPQRPATPKSQKKSTKKRSSSSSRDRSKERGKSFLPRALSGNEKSRNNSHSTGNLTTVANNHTISSVKYPGSNKLWNKQHQTQLQARPASQLGSSIDGMIHREIARAIRDRHALFDP
ncbi:formin-like protein 1 [Parasteatoda tepidariorum]|uniref:formin-like protein 1 n=1 Tax=Parasteatoda tepidariorum TaxID=114398 RepID=UPI00077F87E0|nr:uncharacterized protein LOC107449023 [Parasteatoda tepidariorum]